MIKKEKKEVKLAFIRHCTHQAITLKQCLNICTCVYVIKRYEGLNAHVCARGNQ
jgi:hypothetical protein